MSIESEASGAGVSYGPVKTYTVNTHVSGSDYFVYTGSSSGDQTFTYECTSPTITVPGLEVGKVYQLSSVVASAWSNHKHTNNMGNGSLVSSNEGGTLYKTSPSSGGIITYNGSNSLSARVYFNIRAVCSPRLVAGTYYITGNASCSWDFMLTIKYREVYGYTDGQKIDRVNDSIKEQTEVQKGFFGSFFSNLINAFVSIFVPSSEEMSGLFDQLNQFFSDRFGFLYAPFDYMIQLLGVFTSATGSTGLTFPGFSIMGYDVWSDMTYDLASDVLVGTILEYVRIGTGILLGGWFIMYLQDFFRERFSK